MAEAMKPTVPMKIDTKPARGTLTCEMCHVSRQDTTVAEVMRDGWHYHLAGKRDAIVLCTHCEPKPKAAA